MAPIVYSHRPSTTVSLETYPLYLAKYIAGDKGQAALAEKTRHDKALETYQAAMEKYTREHTQLLDWIETNREIKDQAKQNFTTLITRSSSITRRILTTN